MKNYTLPIMSTIITHHGFNIAHAGAIKIRVSPATVPGAAAEFVDRGDTHQIVTGGGGALKRVSAI